MNKIQYNKNIGQSIFASYSRVMESLAFHIMARIDDLIYVDDAMKILPQKLSLYNPAGLGGLPIQKSISPSSSSIKNTPCASPLMTPIFCSSSALLGCPGRAQSSLSKGILWEEQEGILGKLVSEDVEKVWSYAGNLSTRKDVGDSWEGD